MKRLTPLWCAASVLCAAVFLATCSDAGEDPTGVEAEPEVTQQRRGPGVQVQEAGDPQVLALMREANDELAARGLGVAIESVELFTIGRERPSNRILQQPFRWVAGDPRRNAQGDDITHLVDQSDGATASGLTNAQTEAAIDRALTTWDEAKEFRKVEIVKRADDGSDPDIFDFFVVEEDGDPPGEFGAFGNPFLADIVNAGWLPRAFFEALVEGGGDGVLAVSVTFIFTDPGTGAPTDINGDNYLDTALNEVYYNDNFGDPGGDRAGNPWGIDLPLPGIDVETVALHENGHSLGVGHFGPPPAAVMNPVYAGIRQMPLPTDDAAMSTIWNRWPN